MRQRAQHIHILPFLMFISPQNSLQAAAAVLCLINGQKVFSVSLSPLSPEVMDNDANVDCPYDLKYIARPSAHDPFPIPGWVM